MGSLRRLVEAHVPKEELALCLGEGSGEAALGDSESQERPLHVIEICANPRFQVIPGFLESDEVQSLIDVCSSDSEYWTSAHKTKQMGTSEAYPLEGLEIADVIRERLAEILEVDQRRIIQLRVERYLPGQYTYERLMTASI